ncbi:PIN domain nuclease of toxin-antitoxin system [Mucilaginibacter gracilis]|uniref:PIN domain nuclease of toxin-antitoxin system n=1 Tax=Mucilaginibacter gracilis TaxID=423350 RepID=A0A495J2S5_9SPHI|nr:type II toxin-antitoxin system VapC family toxin [Mucilaginibacter gracilis]RKR82971.1 PIN domain nuclease of toxin-antitoxin system [Mucilaginibacter gracilis]
MALNRYLLDTHVLIWFQESSPNLHKQILDIIQNPDNVILFSQISLFEITIKQTIGKLPSFDASSQEVYLQALNDSFTFVNIQNVHISTYNKIDLMEHHRDPFDRLLIATALYENAIILSGDAKFMLYNDIVETFWV